MHQTWNLFDQNFNFTHEIHRMACMTSLLILASDLQIIWWNMVSMILTYHNPCWSFQIVSNTQLFLTILLWLFTYHQLLTDSDGWTFHKMNSTHPNSNLEDVMEYIIQNKIMGKKPFWDFEFNLIATLKPYFHCRPKSLNCNKSIFAQPILNLRIDPESSWPSEYMVNNPF